MGLGHDERMDYQVRFERASLDSPVRSRRGRPRRGAKQPAR